MEQRNGPIPDRPSVDLAGVLMTHRLDERPLRAGERGQEAAALVAVLGLIATRPEDAVREIVRQAVQLTGSGSGGLSTVEHDANGPAIRWQASTGVVGEDVSVEMPRFNSVCGTAIDHGQPMLMVRPDRAYPSIANAPYPIEETLMVPFEIDGKMNGSLWVVSHDLRKQYDADDRRKLIMLAALAPLALAARKAERPKAVSSERMQGIIRTMPMIVWTATPRLKIDAFSDVWFAYTGQAAKAGVSQWQEAVSSRDLPMVQTAFARAAKEGRPFEVPARLRRHEDADERWHLFTACPSRDSEGNITFWLGTATDFHDAGDAIDGQPL